MDMDSTCCPCLLIAYVACYLLADEQTLISNQDGRRYRYFHSKTEADFFVPACWVEAQVMNRWSYVGYCDVDPTLGNVQGITYAAEPKFASLFASP